MKLETASRVAVGLALALATGALAAQELPDGRVLIDVTALKPELADRLEVESGRLPDTVEVPLVVAAAACGDDRPDVAEQAAAAPVACRARRSTTDVEDAVRDRLDR